MASGSLLASISFVFSDILLCGMEVVDGSVDEVFAELSIKSENIFY